MDARRVVRTIFGFLGAVSVAGAVFACNGGGGSSPDGGGSADADAEAGVSDVGDGGGRDASDSALPRDAAEIGPPDTGPDRDVDISFPRDTVGGPDADADVDGAADLDTGRIRDGGTTGADWTRLIGTAGNDRIEDLATDASGNIYAVGSVQDGFAGQSYNGGIADAFIAKFDSSGSRKWVRLFGGSTRERARAVAVASGSIYVAGSGTGSFGGQTHNGGRSDAFLAEYDGNGNRSWLRFVGSLGVDAGTGVAAASGVVYLGGHTNGPVAGGAPSGPFDAYLAKFDGSGNRQWVELIGSSGTERVAAVAHDGGGGAYLAGRTDAAFGSQSYNGGPRDAFAAGYDAAGNRQWIRLLGSSAADGALDVATGSANAAYVVGRTSGAIGGATHGGGADFFAAKYGPAGSRSWLKQTGKAGDEIARGVSVAGPNRILVAGETSNALGGNPFNGGASDTFAAVYDASGMRQTIDLVGGTGAESGRAVAPAGAGEPIVGGTTNRGLDGSSYGGGASDGLIFKFK